MDLSSMLNNGPPAKKPSYRGSSDTGRSAVPSEPPTPGVDGIATGGGSYTPNQQTPLRGPPSAGASLCRQSTGLTPLQTQGQSQGGQYPFPQAAQSPGTAGPLGQQYRAYDSYSTWTPGARPTSHGYPQPSPSQLPLTGVTSTTYQHPTTSLSPTPPSHHSSYTPHSFRQSPLSVMSQIPHQPPPQQHYHHPSQPSTPLGPPALLYQRTSNHSSHPDVLSPYNQRTLSGTSNGFASGSPAQHHPSIGNLVDSPGAYNHHIRRTSDHIAQIDRERSVSVSPKTKVPPRPPSLSSRHSSQQDLYGSVRSSIQAPSAAPVADAPRHVSHPPTQGVTPPLYSQPPSEVAQTHSVAVQSPYVYPVSATSAAVAAAPLSHASPTPPQPSIQHQSQKMDMHHLLTPANSITSMDGPAEVPLPARQIHSQQPRIFMKPSPRPKKSAVAAPPQQQLLLHEDRSGAEDPLAVERSARDHVSSELPAEAVVQEPEVSESRKRPAESGGGATEEPPTKRGKTMRKYTSRPIWARLKPGNPLYKAEEHGPVDGVAATHSRQQRPPAQGPPAPAKPNTSPPHHLHQSNGMPQQQPNGHPAANGNSADMPPWLQNPPLDQDLIHCRRVLGQWEKTFKWNTPYPDMLRVVQDWLFQQLSQLKDVGNDPREGTVEIEAKIGRISRKGGDEGERLRLPVLSATVLHPSFNDKISFESEMEQYEHEAMNKILNGAITESVRNPGRIAMQYSHPRVTDSFRTLSPAGYQALPPAFQRRPGRDLRLRTSTDTKTGQVHARIVKIGLADLHIFNPAGDYDCRISINLEVNLDRPDLHPEDLIEPPTGEKLAPPDRKKDRLSYRHLDTYSIDLTRVDVLHLASKYELELEVESGVLRRQMELMQRGEPHAFGDVVGGFLDNATFLMRCQASKQQQG